jgi:hypothetical protein
MLLVMFLGYRCLGLMSGAQSGECHLACPTNRRDKPVIVEANPRSVPLCFCCCVVTAYQGQLEHSSKAIMFMVVAVCFWDALFDAESRAVLLSITSVRQWQCQWQCNVHFDSTISRHVPLTCWLRAGALVSVVGFGARTAQSSAATANFLQVLVLLQRLTNTLGTGCPCMYAFAYPILNYSLDVRGPEALNLLEDALLLWIITLRNVPSDSQQPLGLWKHWLSIMFTSIEHIPNCMLVAFSAILLGGAPFAQVSPSCAPVIA